MDVGRSASLSASQQRQPQKSTTNVIDAVRALFTSNSRLNVASFTGGRHDNQVCLKPNAHLLAAVCDVAIDT